MEPPPIIPQIQQRPSRFPLWWVGVCATAEATNRVAKEDRSRIRFLNRARKSRPHPPGWPPDFIAFFVAFCL
jgi:hypothetical protein